MVHRRFYITQEQGFTLIEALAAAVIGSVVILGISMAYLSSLRAFKGGQGKVELQREAAYALETIAKKVREGNEVISDSYIYTVDILVKDTSTTYKYYLEGNNLKGGISSAPVIIIPNSNNYIVSSLSFQDPRGDRSGVRIDLTLSGTGNLSESVVFSTTAYVRARK